MPKKCRIEILPTAWEDLKKIEDYYAVKFGAASAVKVSDHILDTIERLETFPDSGSMIPDKWLNNYKISVKERVERKQPLIFSLIRWVSL